MSAVARRATESLVSVLRWRAIHQPDRLAYVFASEGTGEIRLTYSELDRRARSVAVSLERVASPGDCVLLLYPPGLDFLAAFLGCLYAGVVAIPLFAPRPNREDGRLNAVIEDSGAALALTVTNALPDRSSRGSRWTALDYLFTDTIDDDLADRWREPSISSEELAYLQYTSGSTSAPKGVMVTHANLLYNCAVMQETWELSENTVSVTWLPHFHDMGLIEGLLNPLHAGFPTVLMPPAQFVARPIRWLQLISRYGATHSGAPNFAYDLCVKKIRPEQRADLNLSSWTLAYSGSEPVRPETLEKFAQYFSTCGFRARSFSPGYGLAEATLMVSSAAKSDSPHMKDVDVAQLERGLIVPANGGRSRRLVGCGGVRRATRVSIVDPETLKVCPDGRVGEVWVSGPTVAGGYWKQPEKSLETFSAFIADTNEGPFLRTGDLGFLAGRELFVTGRLKDLIIVRGANYYPQDIEAVVEKAHPALRTGSGVAFSVEIDGVECLVVGHEIDRQFRSAGAADLEEIAAAIRHSVYQEFDLEIYAVQLLKIGSVLKTSSGKIQRQACRADFLAGRSEFLFESRLSRDAQDDKQDEDELRREDLLVLSPADREFALEEHVCRHVASVLQIPSRHIDRSEPLGSYGLESLKNNQLIAMLEDSLGLTLAPTTIFNYPSVSDLSRHLADQMDLNMDAAEEPGDDTVVLEKRMIEDEGLAEILGAVGRLSIAELQGMIAKRSGPDVAGPAGGENAASTITTNDRNDVTDAKGRWKS